MQPVDAPITSASVIEELVLFINILWRSAAAAS